MENLFETLGEILKPQPTILQHLERKAKQAHSWTSFDPEKRGAQMIKDYSEELLEDLEELNKDELVSYDAIIDYKNRYINLFSSYLHAKSNCFSAMITGSSGFNNRKHDKANRSEERHYEIFREWRLRAKKAIIRKAQPPKTFISELDRYRAELAGMQRNQELMKEGNKRIKEAKKKGEDITEYLINTFQIPTHMIDWTMKFGFGLQNNNANMKRIEDRIKELEVKEQMRDQSPVTNYTFEGGKMVIDYEVDRIQIFFDTRPTREELQIWKNKGLNSFNWSPSANAWQRKITANAMSSVKRLLPPLTKEAI